MVAFWLVIGLTNCPKAKTAVPESLFSQLGVQPVATVASDCTEPTDFVFSPDGRRVVYTGWLREDADPKVGVWVNDTFLMRTDSVFELGFNEAGIPYFVGSDSGKAYVYYRFARPRAYERVGSPSFSRDGRNYACLVTNGGRQSLVVGDGSTRTFGNVYSFALNPVGEEFAYAGRDSVDWFVVDGSDTSDIYDEVGSMAYSPDGAHLAYAAEADGNWLVVLDGDEFDPFPDDVIDISDVTLSGKGDHMAYVVTAEDSATGKLYEYPVIDEQEGDAHQDITGLRFSPDGSKLAYAAADGDGQFAVDDYVADPEYDEVWGLTYGADNVRLAYVARDGDEEFIVANGREHEVHESVDRVIFNRSGSRVGYGVLDGRQFSWVVEDAN